MAERRRGLGRGLGALIPSGPAPDVESSQNEKRDAEAVNSDRNVSRETSLTTSEDRVDQSKTSGKSPSEPTETIQEEKSSSGAKSSKGSGSSSAKKKSGGSKKSKDGVGKTNTTVKPDVKEPGDQQSGTDGSSTVVSRETPKARKRTISAEARQKAMKARMDLGVSARSSAVHRPSDMFFTPTPSADEAEEASSPQQSSVNSEDVDKADTAVVSRETVEKPAATEPQEVPEVHHEPSVSSQQEEKEVDKTEEAAPESSNDAVQTASDHKKGIDAASPEARPSDDEHADPAELSAVPGARLLELDVHDIHPNRKQPRQVFDEDELAELAYSIGELGVLQPVVVRRSREADGPDYELVMGERRWRATQRAGLEVIPAIVRDTGDDDLLRDALLENLHRSQLNPLEEAAAYQQLMEEFGASQEELSRRIGRSRPQISNTLRLLRLPALVQRRVAAGVLSAGHARALLGLEDPAEMERLAQRIVAEGLSVRATEEAVTVSKSRKPTVRRSAATQERHRERLDYIADAFSDKLDTSVKINLGARKGRMTIEFASVDDLNRIITVLDPQGLPESQG